MIVGYARVSTDGQSLEAQHAALKEAGAERVFSEDVMLGAFRYCVNQPENEEAGKAMFPTLMSMMWKRERGGKIYVNNCGLVFRPAKVIETKHQTEYEALVQRLQSYLV
jgi:hypothetical protein